VAQHVQQGRLSTASLGRDGHDDGYSEHHDRARISTEFGLPDPPPELVGAPVRGRIMSVSEPTSTVIAPGPAPSARRHLKAFTGLTAVQVVQLFAGLITGPLLARALGADGRGLLAAIAVPLGVAPFVAQLGLGAFAVNRIAKGVAPGRVFGSIAVPLLVVGGAVAVSAPWLASLLSEGREPVDEFLTIGFMLLPLALLINLAMDVAWGLSAWRALASARGLVALSALIGIVVLYLLHELSVRSAAIVTIASAFAPVAALLPIFRRIGRPRPDRVMTRAALSFGVRAWPGTLASLANQRFDQLLMIPLVPARELGLYAVAVTIASLSTVLSSQIPTVVLPRIAGGEKHLLPQTMRALLLTVIATQACLAVGTVLLLEPVFGADFADARPLVFVLLGGWLAQSGVTTLAQSLAATGKPGAPSVGELVSLATTVPALILVLPSMGAMGAAIVTLVAYVLNFAILLVIASRHFDQRVSSYLIPRPDDLRLVAQVFGPTLRRLTRRR
jgi:O-antigen/teichoic acid export membrane protein